MKCARRNGVLMPSRASTALAFATPATMPGIAGGVGQRRCKIASVSGPPPAAGSDGIGLGVGGLGAGADGVGLGVDGVGLGVDGIGLGMGGVGSGAGGIGS